MFFKLKEFYKKESFQPSFVSIFINPSYIIRKGLFKGVSANAKYLKGIMLDFGCGCKPYENLLSVQEYIGLDIQESGHDHAKESIAVFYDGKKIPFGNNHFDAVFSSEVFEHIFNIDEILNELRRVMKPNANILITVPFVWDEHEIPYDFARYTSHGIKYLLESKGFQIIKIEKTTNYVETIFQMWNTYISQYVLPSAPYLKILLNPLFIAPTTMLGILLSKILPDNRNLYHNNIVVAKKLE